jgi:integrase
MLGEAIRSCEGKRLIDPLAANAIRLILLTGCRPSEITNLRWREVHLASIAAQCGLSLPVIGKLNRRCSRWAT